MNNKLLYLLFLSCVLLFPGCRDDWENDNPEMANIYYYGLGNIKFPGGNELVYNVNQGESINIPTYFYSAYTRSYSPEVYYYVITAPGKDEMIENVDYQVVDKDNKVLTHDSNGAYTMIWPKAVGGSQDICIKALNGKAGTLRVLTFDPNKKMVATDVSSTTIIKTNEYEVRGFTENYYITLNIK